MAVIINGDTGIDKITDGSVVAADIGTGEVGATQLANGAVGATQLASTLDLSGKTVTLPAGVGGKVLQVVQDTKTDTFSTNSTSFVDVTGLSVSITPSSTSSKILLLVSLSLGSNGAHASAKILRGSTDIAVGDSAGSRIQATWHYSPGFSYDIDSKNMTWLDSPATTSATTYKIQVAVPWSSSYDVTVNRSSSDTDAAYQSRVVSTITAIEVGA